MAVALAAVESATQVNFFRVGDLTNGFAGCNGLDHYGRKVLLHQIPRSIKLSLRPSHLREWLLTDQDLTRPHTDPIIFHHRHADPIHTLRF